MIKKLDMRELFGDEDVGAADNFAPVCSLFEVGDEFIVGAAGMPDGFCQGAFWDLATRISGLRFGANYPWMKEEGTAVCPCSDGLRPVIFKLERLEESAVSD